MQDERPDDEKTFEELWPDLDDDLPQQRTSRPWQVIAVISFILILLLYVNPFLRQGVDNLPYKNVKAFTGDAPKVPILRSEDPPDVRALPRGEWVYERVPVGEQKLFRAFAYTTPKPLQEVFDRVDQDVTVRFGNKTCLESDSADSLNGSYSCLKVENEQLVLELNRMDINNSPGGRFLLDHELGHLVDYTLFGGKGYEYMERDFKKSDKYKSCYKLEGECVEEAEVFADQIAYYATGYRENFTIYQTPQLLSNEQMERIIVKAQDELVYLDWSVR